MKHKKSVIFTFAFFTVAFVVVGFGTIAAEIGGKSDPLVTVSYLKSLDPELDKTITAEVNNKIDAKLKSLNSRLDQLEKDLAEMKAISGLDTDALANDPAFIEKIADAVVGKLGGGTDNASSQNGSTPAAAKKVEVAAGKTLKLDMGSKVLVRVGTAVCAADNSPGLVDTSAATTIDDGTTLEKNHLYLATFDGGHGFKASDNVTVFVEGSYKIS